MRVAYEKTLAAMLATVGAMSPIIPCAANAESHFKKTWEFKCEHGIVSVGLVTPVDLQSRALPPSLEIFYSGKAHPSLVKEVGLIREVLHEMPQLGVDPHNLSSIAMSGFAEPEVIQRVAIAALHSAEWHNFITRGTGSAEAILEHLLNSLRVYEAFNAALEEYGLRVKTVGAEKASAAKCLDLKIPDLPCSIRHNPRVPTGANLSIVLERTR